MKTSLMLSLLMTGFILASHQALAITAACNLNGTGAGIDQARKNLDIRTKAINDGWDHNSFIEVSVQRSNGNIEVYRGRDFMLAQDGTVSLNMGQGSVLFRGDRVLEVAKAAPGATHLGLAATHAPRVAMATDAVVAAARQYKGEVVMVTTADGTVKSGYLQHVNGEKFIVTREMNPQMLVPGDSLAGQVISVEPAASHFRNEARNFYTGQNRVTVTVKGRTVSGKILGMDSQGMLIQTLGDEYNQAMTMMSERVKFTDVSSMSHEVPRTHAKVNKPAPKPQVQQQAPPRVPDKPQIPAGNNAIRSDRGSNVVQGEIHSPNRYDLDQAFSPSNGNPIATRGDNSYVRFGSSDKSVGKITRIWTDDGGQLHIEVTSVTGPNSLAKPRELSAAEIASLRGNDEAAKKAFEAIEEVGGGTASQARAKVPPPKPKYERKYPPYSMVDTVMVSPGGQLQSVRGNTSIPFFSDAEILAVNQPARSRTFTQVGNKLDVHYNSSGRAVIQQQGQRGCTAAVVEMMAADRGLAPDINHLGSTNLGNTSSMLSALAAKGLKTRVSNPKSAADIAVALSKEGPGIISVGGEIGGHVIIVDAVDLTRNTATIRDPWHGWDVTITLDALMKRVGNYGADFIQVKKL